MKLFDDFPLATVQTLVGFALAVTAYLNGDLTVLEAFAAIGLNGVGAGAVGYVRNQAGRGVVKDFG